LSTIWFLFLRDKLMVFSFPINLRGNVNSMEAIEHTTNHAQTAATEFHKSSMQQPLNLQKSCMTAATEFLISSLHFLVLVS